MFTHNTPKEQNTCKRTKKAKVRDKWAESCVYLLAGILDEVEMYPN